jgi:integrase
MEYAHDIMARVKNERIKRRITKPILTLEQAKRLILKTKTNRKSIWQYRDHAIIYLMLTSGARSQEIIDARKEDYQGKAGEKILYLRNMEEKLSYEFVKIAPGGEAAIDDYIRMRKDKNPYLFVTTKNTSPKQKLSTAFFQRMLKRVLKSCGLENIALTPHSLRHTAATFNLLRGGSITQTKEFLRHKNIQSTYVYVDHLERLKDNSENEIERFILSEAASSL